MCLPSEKLGSSSAWAPSQALLELCQWPWFFSMNSSVFSTVFPPCPTEKADCVQMLRDKSFRWPLIFYFLFFTWKLGSYSPWNAMLAKQYNTKHPLLVTKYWITNDIFRNEENKRKYHIWRIDNIACFFCLFFLFCFFLTTNKNLSQVVKSVSCPYPAMKYHSVQVFHLISFASFKETRITQEIAIQQLLFNSWKREQCC